MLTILFTLQKTVIIERPIATFVPDPKSAGRKTCAEKLRHLLQMKQRTNLLYINQAFFWKFQTKDGIIFNGICLDFFGFFILVFQKQI